MSSAGTTVEVNTIAQAMGPDESCNLDGSDVEMVEEGPKNGEHEVDDDDEDELDEPKETEETDNSKSLNDSIVISDSENDDTPTSNNKSKADEEDDEDVITITANDGSLGRGHLIAPKPLLPEEEDDDNEVELLEEDEDSNSIQAIPNGQDEDALLADEDSSADNSRVFNELDSSLSNDVTTTVDKEVRKNAEDDDDIMLISDEEDSVTSATTNNTGRARSANLNSAQASFLAKSGITIEAVRGRDGFFKGGKNNGKPADDDVVELEDGDPLAGCESDENSSQGDADDTEPFIVNGESNDSDLKANQTTIVVNDTKSLVELANSKKEPGKEPTLVIIDTNSILSGKGPLPMNNKAATPSQQSRSASPGNNIRPSVNSSQSSRNISNAGAQSIDIPDDAFLIEAPSFIVPYVFEKAGEKSLKECITEIAKQVKEEKEAKLARGEVLTIQDEIQEPKKINSEEYFESPVGKLLMNIGMNMVQEYVQIDLLKMQKRQGEKEKFKNRSSMMTMQTEKSIISLKKNIEESKENNEPFKSKTKKCELCNFKTESELVMSTHLETPHMKNYSYRCNFCPNTTRVPQEIIFHMEAEHNVKARLERAPAYHQCPSCQFEDNSKAKLNRHIQGCTKRFNINKNLEPPMDWDTPAKLPKLPKNRMIQQGMNPAYLAANQQRAGLAAFASLAPKYMPMGKGGLPQLIQAPKNKPIPGLIRTNNPRALQSPIVNPHLQRGMMMQGARGLQVQQAQMQLTNNQMLQQVVSGQLLGAAQGVASGFLNKLGLQPLQAGPNASQQKSASSQNMRGAKPSNQPSISITPLPRQSSSPSTSTASQQKPAGKTSFVICEICDGYIKDLDQLRNHMQWIHKVKIHPKMIYNKPPLNCQKCQFRFFTDQGLERHLLGSHGLVTSSMQDAANKGQDSGRCPLCGKVYQWKLLAHVAKDHNVTLKPAHLSYKCTVCTATFGMYKLFESHVYSAHSVTKNSPRPERRGGNQQQQQIPNKMNQLQVTPRTMPTSTSSSNSYKPLKINDEITIIPQPMSNSTQAHRNKGSLTITPQPAPRRNMRNNDDDGIQIIEIDDAPQKMSSNGRSSNQNGDFKARFQMSETLRKRNLEISLCGTDSDNSDDSRGPNKRLRLN